MNQTSMINSVGPLEHYLQTLCNQYLIETLKQKFQVTVEIELYMMAGMLSSIKVTDFRVIQEEMKPVHCPAVRTSDLSISYSYLMCQNSLQ